MDTARVRMASVSSSPGRHALGLASMTHRLPIGCPSADVIGTPAHAPTPHGPIAGWPAVRESFSASATTNGPFVPMGK